MTLRGGQHDRRSRAPGLCQGENDKIGPLPDKWKMRLSGSSSTFRTFQALREAPEVGSVDVGDFRHFSSRAAIAKCHRMHQRADLFPGARRQATVLSVTGGSDPARRGPGASPPQAGSTRYLRRERYWGRKRSQSTAGGDTRPLAGLTPLRRQLLGAWASRLNTSGTGTRLTAGSATLSMGPMARAQTVTKRSAA